MSTAVDSSFQQQRSFSFQMHPQPNEDPLQKTQSSGSGHSSSVGTASLSGLGSSLGSDSNSFSQHTVSGSGDSSGLQHIHEHGEQETQTLTAAFGGGDLNERDDRADTLPRGNLTRDSGSAGLPSLSLEHHESSQQDRNGARRSRELVGLRSGSSSSRQQQQPPQRPYDDASHSRAWYTGVLNDRHSGSSAAPSRPSPLDVQDQQQHYARSSNSSEQQQQQQRYDPYYQHPQLVYVEPPAPPHMGGGFSPAQEHAHMAALLHQHQRQQPQRGYEGYDSSPGVPLGYIPLLQGAGSSSHHMHPSQCYLHVQPGSHGSPAVPSSPYQRQPYMPSSVGSSAYYISGGEPVGPNGSYHSSPYHTPGGAVRQDARTAAAAAARRRKPAPVPAAAAYAQFPPYAPAVPSPQAAAQSVRPRAASASMMDFINSAGATSELTVDDVRGAVLQMAADQMGCRHLQRILTVGGLEVAETILEEVQDNLAELMVDPFGNYLFQKLVEVLPEAKREEIVLSVAHTMANAGLSIHGTRCVQKVVEVSTTRAERDAIICALQESVVDLSTSVNGNHIMQRVLQHFRSEDQTTEDTDTAFIYRALQKSCLDIGMHRHGCCVVQRALDAATVPQRAALVQEVGKHALVLMQDPFGNYVCQYFCDKCTSEEIAPFFQAATTRIVQLSMQKFSSNVVEKCIEKASPATQTAYVQELLAAPSVISLLRDQYANYVIQKAISVAPVSDALELIKAIKPHLATIRNTSGGRRLTSKMAQRFPDLELTDSSTAAAAAAAAGMTSAHAHSGVTQQQQQQPVQQQQQLSGDSDVNNRSEA